MNKIKMSNYLIHFNHNHGPDGRFTSSNSIFINGTNRNIEDYTILKNTRVDRVTTNSSEKNVGRTYGTITQADRNKYLSISNDWLSATHKIQLSTIKDVKVAGKSAQSKAFENILNNTNINKLVDHSHPSNSTRIDRSERKQDYKIYKNAYKNQENFDKALLLFNKGLSYGNNSSSTLDKKFYSELTKNGYDAAVDLNDLNYSEKPIIFIKREDSLKIVKISQISQKDLDNAQIWLRKHRYE